MANLSGIARPYALAAFEYARDQQQLSEWKAFLGSAAHMAVDPVIVNLLANPSVSATTLFDLFCAVLTTQLDTERKNFLLLLSQNKRLLALPEIVALFNAHLAVLEKISNVRVITAIAMQDDYKQTLTQALTKRIKHAVKLHCETDPLIIGGAVIHMGDRVIDGSIRGKLSRLLESLTS